MADRLEIQVLNYEDDHIFLVSEDIELITMIMAVYIASFWTLGLKLNKSK